jgi:hypothetical protein
MWQPKYLSFLIVAVVVVIAGCRSPQDRVGERVFHFQADWETNVAHQASLPQWELDWPAAFELMFEGNPRLRQLRIERTNAQENVRQIFRDLTPTLNFRTGFTQSIRNLGATTFDDVTFSIDSFFNIPGLVNFGARYYIARLLHFRAETVYALGEREQAIELYRLFHLAQDAQEQAGYVEAQRDVAAALAEIDPFTSQMMMTQLDIREIGIVREINMVQQRAGELFGDLSYRWIFSTNGLPELRYHLEPIPIQDPERVAHLQILMAAIELEVARAQLAGMKLRYWPELTMFVTAPPIYQRAFGQERFWDLRDVRLSANLFWSIDTRGQIARTVRQTKRSQELQRERIRQEGLALVDRLLLTQSLLEASVEQAGRVDAQFEVLRQFPPEQNFLALQKYSDDLRALADQQRALRREIVDLQTLFWFVDEEAWVHGGAIEEIVYVPDAN